MKELSEHSAVDAKRNSTNVFSLAVTVGFVVALITSDLAGGLTAIQGFLAGFFAVMAFYVLACLLENRVTRASGQQKIYLSIPANASITQVESESGITIQIQVHQTPALKQEARHG